MPAKIVRVDPLNIDLEKMREAADVIIRGGLVAFPTETVYGLGCDALNRDAARRVFEVKRRPVDNPLIIHVKDFDQLNLVAREIPEKAYKLIKRLWPGPLTLILPRRREIPLETTGGLDTVAVRSPAHPVALKLIELSERPIAAPSANISGRPSPTKAEHVIEDLYDSIDMIIDSGETLFGLESTIINILTSPPTLLRPGAYPVEVIEEILGERVYIPDFARGLGEAERTLAPGTRYRHYAPKTPLVVVEAREYNEQNIDLIASELIKLVRRYHERYKRLGIIATRETLERMREVLLEGVRIYEIGRRNNLYEIARNVFDLLRRLDKENIEIAFIEGVEERGIGLSIMNRIRKASTERVIVG